MIFNLFRKSTAPDTVFEAYRSIVAQSRQAKFYADWGIPDTVTGRFDMISLHLALLLRRLKGNEEARPFGQALVDLFFRDMDRSVRELGITDLGVPKRIKKMGNVFYGLVKAIDDAIDSDNATEVEAVLLKNVYAGPSPGIAQLANYLLAESKLLTALPTATITAGQSTSGVAA